MDNEDRQKILQNIDRLIQCTKYDALMEQCMKRGLLFDVMQEQIEIHPDEKVRHRKLLEKITHRGPTAYSTFESILKENFPDTDDLLVHISYGGSDVSIHRNQSNGRNTNNRANSPIDPPHAPIQAPNPGPSPSNKTRPIEQKDDDIPLEVYTAEVYPPRKIIVKPSTRFHEGKKVSTYEMKSRNRGVLFLVNIINFKDRGQRIRNGAHVDRDNLIALFRGMGFIVFYYEDITRNQFLRLTDKLLISSYLKSTDCLVLCILSHGERDYSSVNVVFSDNGKIDVEDIPNKFNNHNCPVLVGKPKIFLFPFCRGKTADPGIPARKSRTESDHLIEARSGDIPNIPTISDVKICYATTLGCQSFRDVEKGSWYIEIMCQVWAEHAHDTHFEDLLKIVGNTTSNRRTEDNKQQTPGNDDRGFYKLLYFNPGFYK